MSARSAPEILLLNDEYTFLSSIFLANCSFYLILFLIPLPECFLSKNL